MPTDDGKDPAAKALFSKLEAAAKENPQIVSKCGWRQPYSCLLKSGDG